MYIYNTTFFIDDNHLPEVRRWLDEHYIKQALAGGTMRNPRLLRIIGSSRDTETAYALQMEAETLAALHQWRNTQETSLLADLSVLFLGQVRTISTIMQTEDINSQIVNS